MELASTARSTEDQATYVAAQAKLFIEHDGRMLPTPEYELYLEYRRLYHDLRDTEASATDLSLAMTDWSTLGHKATIESALAQILRIESKPTTSHRIMDERDALQVRLDSMADPVFAETFYAPASAASPEDWLEARVTFEDLERSIATTGPWQEWRNWRAGRSGSVTFRYATLDIFRPWFTSALYSGDDWRMGDASVVSTGDGITGQLPAFADSVMIARVDRIDYGTTGKPPTPHTPTSRTTIFRRTVTPTTTPARKGLSISQAPRRGVVALPVAGRTWLSNTLSPTTGFARPGLTTGTTLPAIQRPLRTISLQSRMQLATSLIDNRKLNIEDRLTRLIKPQRSQQADADETIYVVGFGCTKIPAAPSPNPNHSWLN